MSEATKAVFLSYASQDAEAAKKICDALRAAGVEVWFDQSELVGGDAWDAKIRKQIKECALLIPVISAATQARTEGYFRLEWRLADQRTHLMAKGRAFLLPVVIDDTRDTDAHVPDSFTEVQWTKLPGGETPPGLALRVQKLLANEVVAGPRIATSATPGSRRGAARWWWALPVFGVTLALFLVIKEGRKDPGPPPAIATFAPAAPPKISEARALALRASALLADPMLVRESVTAAEELCARAVAMDPQDGEAWAVYALVATVLISDFNDDTSVQRENARSRAERAIRLTPDSVNAALAMAEFEFFADNNPKAAEIRLRALLARVPEDKRIAHILGWALAAQGRSEECFAVLDTAARQPGGNYLALARKGWGLMHAGRWREAETAFDASLALQPNRDALHGKLLYLVTYLGDLDRARALFASLPPGQLREDRVAYLAYQMGMRQRQPDQAGEALRRINHDFIKEGRISMPTRFGLAEAQQLAGRSQAATVEWESALATVELRLKAEPADPDLASWRTLLLARLGRRQDAERAFDLWCELAGIKRDEVQEMDPDLLLALGRPDDAITVIKMRMSAGQKFSPQYYLTLRDDPKFDALRARPEFATALKEGEIHRREFLAKIGLSASSPASSTIVPSVVDEKSVAVLAFANLSDDKANEYFSDGISEELLNVLAKVPGLKVTARTSSFHFKGKDTPIPEIARQLGVAYVVEGSVRKQGDKVRITAQLIKAADDFHAWSDTFTRDLKDIFAVQDEIAGLIAQNLQLKLGMSAQAGQTANAEAHQLYLQGKYFLGRTTLEDTARATTLLQRAVELDPSFALAWAALSGAGAFRGGYGNNRQDFDEGYALARRAADRAIALEPALAAGHIARFDLQSSIDFDWKGSLESLQRAQALAPNDPAVVFRAATLAYTFGEEEQATELIRQAVALDPVNPSVYVNQGYIFLAAHRFAEAEAAFRHIAEVSPAAPWGHAGIGLALTGRGQCDQAVAEAKQESAEWSRLFVLALAEWGRKNHAEADRVLAQFIASNAEVAAYQIACVYGYRGESDKAFEWLERAYRQRDPGLSWAKPDFFLQSQHADPRWDAFLHKLGLADDQLK